MKRRNLILGALASGVGMTRVVAQTAAKKLPRIVAISNGDEAGYRPSRESVVTGMHALGQIEGRTYRLEIMYANREPLRAVGLIADAVASRPDILLVAGLTNAKRARDATTTIPVVVATSGDLVDAGVIASFSRPGGNVTGITDLADELAEKRLELLVELHPRAKRVALLNNPDFPAAAKIETRVVAAAERLGVNVLPIYARDRASLSLAVESLRNSRADALLIGGDGLFVVNAESLIQEAGARGVPVVHYWPGTAEMGALMSYQADILKNYERAAYYLDRILKGAKPGDLPVERPARYELVVSRKAAQAFGISIAPSIALRADRIID
jgi:putative tryptophan/tyrosine transport system substrate-binding protein